MGMDTKPAAIKALLLITFIGLGSWESLAYAERPSPSDSPSTIQPQCDLCWTPPSNGPGPNRLPTFKPHRPPHPPDSRPHRLPKGRYKLTPTQKHSRLSTLRKVSARSARAFRNQQIVAIDGDTIRYGTERIRLQGIDTPELNEPGGLAAKKRLEDLLRSGPVRIVPHGVDVYGRTVADVFVNGQNVAEMLTQDDFGLPHF